MFGIGPTELVVILVIALLVIGPSRLPELARSLGKGLAEFKRATSDISKEFEETRQVLEEDARALAREEMRRERSGERTPPGAMARGSSSTAPAAEPAPESEGEAGPQGSGSPEATQADAQTSAESGKA